MALLHSHPTRVIARIHFCRVNGSPLVLFGLVDRVWYGTCNLLSHRPKGVGLSLRITVL